MSRNSFIGRFTKCALVIGALSPLILAGCRNKKDATREVLESKAKEAKETAKSHMQDFGNVVSKGTKYGGYDSKGRPLWEVKAETSRASQEKTENGVTTPFKVTMENATARLFKDGKPESTFHAPRILFVKGPKGPILTLSGGVRMMVPPSRLATTSAQKIAARGAINLGAPEARIDVKVKRLFCPQGATMTQGTSKVTAKQLAADTDLGEARLTGGMTAQAPEGSIAAHSAIWNWRTHRLSAEGGVSAIREKTVIKGARLEADTDASSGEVTGGVTAQSEGGTAQASRARFDWKRGTLQADGNVRLSKDGGSLAAARIDTDKAFARAVASGGVTLQKENATLRASKIEAWDKLARATASGGVTLVKDGATITAPSVEAWLKEKRAVANGGVRLQRAGWDVHAASVQSTNLGEASQRVVATGGVRATSDKGDVHANRVELNGDKVLATGDVRFSRDGNSLMGQKLVADDKFDTARLTGSVGGEGSGANLSARDIVWRRAAGSPADGGQISAKDGVKARWKNLKVRADTLEAAGNGRRATAAGNVVITSDEGATITAPSARYDKAANTVTATGPVVMTDPKKGITQRGRMLVYDLTTKRARMKDFSGHINGGLSDLKLFQ